jgi:hypothetical protein
MPRVKRRAYNQTFFREVNENIAELSAQFGVGTQAFFCECSQTGCTEMLDVPAEVYERFRSDSSCYLVRRGHRDPAQELIVEDFGDYLIVQTGSASSPREISARPAGVEVA